MIAVNYSEPSRAHCARRGCSRAAVEHVIIRESPRESVPLCVEHREEASRHARAARIPEVAGHVIATIRRDGPQTVRRLAAALPHPADEIREALATDPRFYDTRERWGVQRHVVWDIEETTMNAKYPPILRAVLGGARTTLDISAEIEGIKRHAVAWHLKKMTAVGLLTCEREEDARNPKGWRYVFDVTQAGRDALANMSLPPREPAVELDAEPGDGDGEPDSQAEVAALRARIERLEALLAKEKADHEQTTADCVDLGAIIEDIRAALGVGEGLDGMMATDLPAVVGRLHSAVENIRGFLGAGEPEEPPVEELPDIVQKMHRKGAGWYEDLAKANVELDRLRGEIDGLANERDRLHVRIGELEAADPQIGGPVVGVNLAEFRGALTRHADENPGCVADRLEFAMATLVVAGHGSPSGLAAQLRTLGARLGPDPAWQSVLAVALIAISALDSVEVC